MVGDLFAEVARCVVTLIEEMLGVEICGGRPAPSVNHGNVIPDNRKCGEGQGPQMV